MTNIEFIDVLIRHEQKMLKAYEKYLSNDETKADRQITKTYKQTNQKFISRLQQIKAKLEAWEVVKKCLSISTDSWDEYSESFEFISFTVAGVHPLLGFDRQEIESIKKALEVKDEI